jgi:signal transduction histidine kinase
MTDDELKRFASLHYWVGSILLAVCYWDIFILKVSDLQLYYPYKVFTISVYVIVAYLVKKEKLKPLHGFDISCTTFYIYSYIGTTYLHSTYIFSFYEGLLIICFVYTGSFLRYSFLTLFGLILTVLSIQHMPEPEFIKQGYSLRPHLQILTVILGVLTFVVYWFFNRQRELLYKLDQKFASIGRQSTFLLHELKSPLSRFMMRNSEKENRDAEYILSIVEGVELLISKKENLSFASFNWEDIRSYLEDEFHETCKHYKIKLVVSGLEGLGFGHRSTIKLALKNLIKNAVESIALEEKQGIIMVSRNENVVTVSNNGSVINKEKLDQLFKPFYTEKNTKTNYGIGLHFVESVVKAHDGTIRVQVENGWNIFKIKLGEVS